LAAGRAIGDRAMAKQTFDNYLDEIRFQREIWAKKPQLRELYGRWYADCSRWFSPLRPVLEVGAGCGNFKQFFPEAITSDVFHSGDWIDLVMDAQALPLKPNATGNLLVFDVMHHLPRPLEFLGRAIAALKPGGRLVICEPALSLWSRLIYGTFHHEPLDPKYDPFSTNGDLPGNSRRTFANSAIPELLFFKGRQRTLALLPQARMIVARKFAFLLYPLNGGFGYRSLIPLKSLSFLMKLEDAVTAVLPASLIALRMLVVFEKEG
jgi:SAM-dependent methyltransferase